MPAWLARSRNPDNARSNVLKHNLAGMPGVPVMPQVLDAKRDWVIDTKKRYDCFVGTDLDFVLRTHGITTVFITGVNPNSCALSTACSPFSPDYPAPLSANCPPP